MAGLPVNTVMHGNPYNSAHEVSPVLLADLLREIQTLAGVNGTIVDIRDTLSGLTAVGLAEGEYGMVVSAADEAGIYEMSGGSLVRRAAVPAVFLESTASVQALAARDETETLRDAAVAASTAAVQARDQSVAAAQAAGAPIYPDTTAGLAGVAEGETFLVPGQSGLLIYVKTGGAADPQGRLGELWFDTVAEFLAYDGSAVPVGTYARTRDLVGVYQRVADGTGYLNSDNFVAVAGNRGIDIRALGAVGQDDTADTAAFTLGMQLCEDYGITLFVPYGRWHYAATENRNDNVTILGEKMPHANQGDTKLVNGSVIVGTLLLKGLNPSVCNIGIDHGFDEFGTTYGNALQIANLTPYDGTPSTRSTARVENVIGLCGDPEDTFHALLVEGHGDTTINNVQGIRGWYGLAVKCRYGNINGVLLRANGSDSMILKSDNVSGKCEALNVANVVIQGCKTSLGGGSTANGIRVKSLGEGVDRVNINGVSCDDVGTIVNVDNASATATAIQQVNVSNVTGAATNTAFQVLGGTGGGGIYTCHLKDITATSVAQRTMNVTGNVRFLKVGNLTSNVLSSSTYVNDNILVDASVRRTMWNNIDLPIDYHVTNVAGITLANNYPSNHLGGGINAMIGGAGIPRPGYTENTLSGASQTITPIWDGSGNSSTVRAALSAAATVTAMPQTMPSGTRWPRGFVVRIINDGGYVLTVNHNPAGFIYNRGSTAVVLNPNETVEYVFYSAVWHQL